MIMASKTSERGATRFTKPADYPSPHWTDVFQDRPSTYSPGDRPKASKPSSSPRREALRAERAAAAAERRAASRMESETRRVLDAYRKMNRRLGLPEQGRRAERTALSQARRGLWPLQAAKVLFDLADYIANRPLTKLPGNWVVIQSCAYPGPFYARSNHPLANCWNSGTFDPSAYVSSDADINQPFNSFYWDIGLMPGSFPHPFNVGGITRYQKAANTQGRFDAYIPSAVLSPWPWLDPNVSRDLPSVQPELQVTVPDTQAEPEAVPETETDPKLGWPVIGRVISITANPGRRPSRPTDRKPPNKNEKHKKVISRSKAFALAFMKGLDTVSELAEIVDAFYEAIPKELRREYERGLGFHFAKVDGKWKWLPPQSWETSRSPYIDTAGQYGIDGADWKLPAIWKHFDQIDAVGVVENITGNIVEDQLIGALNRARPKNSVNAFEGSDRMIGKELNALMDGIDYRGWLGLR